MNIKSMDYEYLMYKKFDIHIKSAIAGSISITDTFLLEGFFFIIISLILQFSLFLFDKFYFSLVLLFVSYAHNNFFVYIFLMPRHSY